MTVLCIVYIQCHEVKLVKKLKNLMHFFADKEIKRRYETSKNCSHNHTKGNSATGLHFKSKIRAEKNSQDVTNTM